METAAVFLEDWGVVDEERTQRNSYWKTSAIGLCSA